MCQVFVLDLIKDRYFLVFFMFSSGGDLASGLEFSERVTQQANGAAVARSSVNPGVVGARAPAAGTSPVISPKGFSLRVLGSCAVKLRTCDVFSGNAGVFREICRDTGLWLRSRLRQHLAWRQLGMPRPSAPSPGPRPPALGPRPSAPGPAHVFEGLLNGLKRFTDRRYDRSGVEPR